MKLVECPESGVEEGLCNYVLNDTLHIVSTSNVVVSSGMYTRKVVRVTLPLI